MRRVLYASATLMLLFALSPMPLHATAAKGDVHWSCTRPLLPDPPKSTDGDDADVGEGISYLFVGSKRMSTNYGVSAMFSTPSAGKRGWYGNSIMLKDWEEGTGAVQLMLIRQKRFNYRPDIAVSWAVPHSAGVFKDTGIVYGNDSPHLLGIFVANGAISLRVDGRTVCSALAATFFAPERKKFIEIRSEAAIVGSAGAGTVSDIRYKSDVDEALRPYTIACEMRRHGVAWVETRPGVFDVRGAYYPDEATLFTGTDPNAPCRT